jgi:hypothetical protein
VDLLADNVPFSVRTSESYTTRKILGSALMGLGDGVLQTHKKVMSMMLVLGTYSIITKTIKVRKTSV